jgi:hypothetical protein
MNVDERIERMLGLIEAHDRQIEAHDRQIEAHDRQIDALIVIAEQQHQRWQDLEKQWQAYLNTIHPRQ